MKLEFYAAAKSLAEANLPGNPLFIRRTLKEKYGVEDNASIIETQDQIYTMISTARDRALYRLGDDRHPLDDAFIITEKALADQRKRDNVFTEAGKDIVNGSIDKQTGQNHSAPGHSAFDVYSLIRGIFAFDCPGGKSFERLDPVNAIVQSGFGPVKFPTEPSHKLSEWEHLLEQCVGPEAIISNNMDEVNLIFSEKQQPEAKSRTSVITDEPGKPTKSGTAPVSENIKSSESSQNKKSISAGKTESVLSSEDEGKLKRIIKASLEDLFMSVFEYKRKLGWSSDRIVAYLKNKLHNKA